MNMSDDVSSATLQVSMKAAEQTIETTGHALDRMLDQIAKLLQALSAKKAANKNLKATDLTDIKPGEVSVRELITSAKQTRDTLSTSEHGLTAADKKIILRKAKEYGIPVAFTGDKGKDNLYANVRTNDLSIFRQICTDMMKEKLAKRPEELGNFKTQEWEIPFIAAELKRHDLSAQFGKTNSGEHFALYDKVDEKAILIARGEFIRKCNELQNQMNVDKDENGFFTIKDLHTGREVSFDQSMAHAELSRQLQQQFDYDENKANIACAKFGEENLQGEEKQRFFSSNPQNDFSKIDSNITVEGEHILVKPYDCWRITPKSDHVPKIVFRDANGNLAIVNPEKMTQKEMRSALQNGLKITDAETLTALTDKAQKVADYYTGQEVEFFTHNRDFAKSDFDLSNPEVASGMLRTDEHGHTLTKTLPVTELANNIERSDKDKFMVVSIAQSVETDQHGANYPAFDRQELILSFSDKKNALAELTAAYRKQGVPQHIAAQMAKEVFSKAESQSAEKVLQIEEIKLDTPHYKSAVTTIDVKCGTKTESIDITDADAAKAELMKKFNVTESAAACTLDKAHEMVTEREEQVLQKLGFRDVDQWTMDEAHEMISEIEKNHWTVPDNITPNEFVPERLQHEKVDTYINDKPDVKIPDGSASVISDAGGDKLPELPDIPKMDMPTGGRGGR